MRSFNENIKDLINESVNLLNNKKGKTIIKEFSTLIKNDEILLNEFKIFDKLHKGIDFTNNDKNLVNLFIENVVNIFNKYDKNDIKKSNQKLLKFITENNIKQDYNDSDVETALNVLINENINMNNIERLSYAKNLLSENLVLVKEKIQETVDYDLLTSITLSKFNDKYSNLTEEDKSLVNDILSANTLEEQKKCFNKVKSDCLLKLNSLIKESNEINEKERLLNHKENIMNKTISESNFEDELKILIEYQNILGNFN